jgi:predicted RNase H-like HicB family nuclease
MKDYMVIYEQGDKGWGAYSPDLPGVYAAGTTREQVEQRMREAIPTHLEGLREQGISIPGPHNEVGMIAA